MTRFRSDFRMSGQLRFAGALALAFFLSGCVTPPGDPANVFVTPEIEGAYIPLEATTFPFTRHFAAGMAIAPGVAVTNAHNSNLLDPKSVIARVTGYDLLFFRTQRAAITATAQPQMNEEVIAYGQSERDGLRMSHGMIRQFWPAAFGYESDAGPGFSGGPVVDAQTGALLGITYGYLDRDGHRLMLAYTIAFVAQEWAKVQASAAAR
jgi:hypothetical protein